MKKVLSMLFLITLLLTEKINCDGNNATAPIVGTAAGMGIGAIAGGWKGAAIGGPLGLLGGLAFSGMKKGNNNKSNKSNKNNKKIKKSKKT